MELAMDSYGGIALRLGVAFVLGGLVGLEREWQQRPAGLRTHILVAVASALFAIISGAAAEGGGDASRVAAGVVTGIGFIGAGTIMRHGNVVRGLTTAASLWMVAAIGVACGLAWYPAAILATLMSLFTLVAVDWLEEDVLRRSGRVQLNLGTDPERDLIADVTVLMNRYGAKVVSLKYGPVRRNEPRMLSVRLQLADKTAQAQLCRELEELEGISDVQME